jgi:S1-C subfamily serine protease
LAGDIIYKKLKSSSKNPDKNKRSSTDTNGNHTMPVGETIKMVGIRKKPNEPLGLTVEMDEFDQVVVARIIAGGMIDRQGLLTPGDVVLEVNGIAVHSPEELQTEISRAKESVTLKIGPSVDEEMKSARLIAGGSQVKSKTQEAGKKLAVSAFYAF